MANTRPICIVYSDGTHCATRAEAYRIGRSVNMVNARVTAIRKMLVDDRVKRADIYNEYGRCAWVILKDGIEIRIKSAWSIDRWLK